MKALKYKSLIIAAALLIVSGLTSESVFAQRGSRGGGGGGGSRGGGGSSASVSRGGGGGGGRSSGATMSRGSGPSVSRGSSTISRGPSASVGRNNGAISNGNPRSYSRGQQSSARVSGRNSISRSGYGRPGNGRPGYGRPGYGRPGYGRPGYYGYRGRVNYGYYNYYRPYLGFSLNILPFGYYPFYYGDSQFFYSGGLFYRQYDTQYRVVEPPVGAEINGLPSEATQVEINGQTFYEYKGIYYTETQDVNGKTVYVVAGKDGVLNTDGTNSEADTESAIQIGDIVTVLPEGTNQVTLKGEIFYVSPDNVYYEKQVEGTTVQYKVVGL